jgi:uncharacterized protein YndB with AHSA1/START domain
MADLIHSITVAAPPAAVYPLVANGRGFQAWWAQDVTVKPDEVTELGFFDRTTVYRLRPVTLEDNHRAVWQCESGQEWSGTRLIFELENRNATTLVRFSHAGWQKATEFFVSCNTTWGELMFRLKAAAEGKAPGPLFRRSSLAY